MKQRTVNVTEFKAQCLALLDEIGEHGGRITITRRGYPLATVGPVERPAWKSPEGAWAGKVKIASGLLQADTAEPWDVLRAPSTSGRR
jgi:antitoxin (DNA-binding transcriptional repressor) of toxin-antitoxin stability system